MATRIKNISSIYLWTQLRFDFFFCPFNIADCNAFPTNQIQVYHKFYPSSQINIAFEIRLQSERRTVPFFLHILILVHYLFRLAFERIVFIFLRCFFIFLVLFQLAFDMHAAVEFIRFTSCPPFDMERCVVTRVFLDFLFHCVLFDSFLNSICFVSSNTLFTISKLHNG